jgi:hypothetical protein
MAHVGKDYRYNIYGLIAVPFTPETHVDGFRTPEKVLQFSYDFAVWKWFNAYTKCVTAATRNSDGSVSWQSDEYVDDLGQTFHFSDYVFYNGLESYLSTVRQYTINGLYVYRTVPQEMLGRNDNFNPPYPTVPVVDAYTGASVGVDAAFWRAWKYTDGPL